MYRPFNDLRNRVVLRGYCLKCMACVASCPFEALGEEEETPTVKQACMNCGICYAVCPQVIDTKELEGQIFGRRSSDDEPLGIYQQALSVEARDADIKAHAQDGGAVTSILASLLEDGFIDGAIVMGIGSLPWQPSPKVATTREELIACAGTKYARGPLFLGLRDAVDLHYCSRVAIVGTPCQIAASRRMQLSELTNRRLGETIKLHIGLFCGRAFEYEKFFRDVIEKQIRIPLSEVVKFDINRGRFIIYRKQKPRRELACEALERYACFPCTVCSDFAAELADISIGAEGSPLDRSTVLLRTPLGVDAFDITMRFRKLNVTELEDVKPGAEAIERASRDKKLKAAKQLELLQRQGKSLPVWKWERKATAGALSQSSEGS